jgi:hypothetical protein
MAHIQRDLEVSIRHVTDGERRVEQLKELIGRERDRGRSTALAEQCLDTMLTTLRLMRIHTHRSGLGQLGGRHIR